MEITTSNNININPARINGQICNICKKKLNEPVRCTACRSLFCKICCEGNIQNCPVCDFYPFKVMKKEIYDKFLKTLRLYKLYKFALEKRYNCNCVFCSHRCHQNNFLEHILLEHKDLAIDVFNKKKINSNKQRLLTQIFNQS